MAPNRAIEQRASNVAPRDCSIRLSNMALMNQPPQLVQVNPLALDGRLQDRQPPCSTDRESVYVSKALLDGCNATVIWNGVTNGASV